MLPTSKLTLELKTGTESEGMEKGIPYKWKSKESHSSNTCVKQDRL